VIQLSSSLATVVCSRPDSRWNSRARFAMADPVDFSGWCTGSRVAAVRRDWLGEPWTLLAQTPPSRVRLPRPAGNPDAPEYHPKLWAVTTRRCGDDHR
jgi:hypothetical protein